MAVVRSRCSLWFGIEGQNSNQTGALSVSLERCNTPWCDRPRGEVARQRRVELMVETPFCSAHGPLVQWFRMRDCRSRGRSSILLWTALSEWCRGLKSGLDSHIGNIPDGEMQVRVLSQAIGNLTWHKAIHYN